MTFSIVDGVGEDMYLAEEMGMQFSGMQRCLICTFKVGFKVFELLQGLISKDIILINPLIL